jgi:hypothetical protein
MANHLKGEVVLEAGGEKLTFRLGVNEMIRIQDALGLAEDDAKFLGALSNLRSFKAVRTIVHSGLLRDQPETTEEQAGDVVTELGMGRVAEVIQQALRWAMPEKKPSAGGEKRGDKPRPSVGPTPS